MDAAIKKQIPKPDTYKPEPKFAKGHRYAGRDRCPGWNGTHGRQCLNLPAKGRNVCRYHGGSTKRGVEHHSFKHGRYSAALEGHGWAARYVDHLNDPDRLSLADEIAIMNVRIEETMAQIDTTATLDILKRIEEQASLLLTAFLEGDAKAIQARTNTIYNMTVAARQAREAEQQLDQHFDRVANLVTREAQREAKREELFTIQAVIGLVVRMADIFREAVVKHVEPKEATLILNETEQGMDRQMLSAGGN